MKLLPILLFLSFCLVEIYCQRSRTTVTNEDVSREATRPARTRGRARFSATEELVQIPEQTTRTTTNRRASTRTRIHSNNPKAAAERRARPTEASRGYAVEEINNDSPIEAFRRQSKSRVLTENRFETASITATRRPVTFEATTPLPPVPVEELGFGSTARAILQARGETVPPKTTTPIVDEQYLLTNFGSTIKSLAAASRNAFQRKEPPSQKAIPLRSEVPILEREDIPLRRSSLRAEPLPSLRGSDIIVERQPPVRSRNGGRAKPVEAQVIPEKRVTTEEAVVEEFAETDAIEAVQGLSEQSDLVTETQPLEVSSETQLAPEEEDIRKYSPEITATDVTYAPTPRRLGNARRNNGGRGRSYEETDATPASRTRAPRTRPTRKPEESEIRTSAPSRTRINRRRFEDPEVAESRHGGPSVFTAEQYQEVTPRARTGRRIDSRYENIPERITVELPVSTTIRSRISGRRATTAGSYVPETPRERSSRGRGRSKIDSNQFSSLPPITRNSPRRASSSEDTTTIVRRDDAATIARRSGSLEIPTRRDELPVVSRRAGNIEEQSSYGERSSKNEINTPRSSSRKANSAEVSSSRRSGRSRFEETETKNTRPKSRSSSPAIKKDSFVEVPQVRSRHSNRNTAYRQELVEETTIYYGEKQKKTDPPETTTTTTTTTTTEKPTQKANSRLRSRFSEVSPRIDESKLEGSPLFEREPKLARRSRGHRSKLSVNKGDHMEVSATENDVKFVEKPTTSAFTRVTVTRTESVEASTSRARLSTRTASTTTEAPTKKTSSSSSSSSTSSTSSTARTTRSSAVTTTIPPETTTIKRWITRSPPMIKESVVAEINQVTSKSTITRRKKVPKAKAAEMLSTRGTKKADVKLTEAVKKKSVEEEIDEEDNYPEPFKALIQAKRLKEDVKLSIPTVPMVKSTSTERVIVSSAAAPRGPSTARAITTTTTVAVPPTRSNQLNEIVNENENELDPASRVAHSTSNFSTTTTTPKPNRTRLLPKFSEKPKYQQQKPKGKYTRSTEKPSEKITGKTTLTPRKTYSTKSYSTRASSMDHHFKRKALRSTAFPPSTTPLTFINKEVKFSAKFVKKDNNNPDSGEIRKYSLQAKGLPTSRKIVNGDSQEEHGKGPMNMDFALIQTARPYQPIKKINSSRYSSRYRSDTSTRSSLLKSTTSAPFYIPTIPTPAYVPTIPTRTPSVTPVDGIVAVKDADLGVEVISFDEPINSIPSADLVNGEYLTTDKNLKINPMVKDGTTEKPVSIIERIINSITLISTTEAPNATVSDPAPSSTTEATNSAILKLATKKTINPKDKTKTDVQTNIIETITSEKPTTIIEKIRSSLSAIQTNEVGTSDINTVGSSSTTPLSTVTKYSAKFRGSSVGNSTIALPAPQPLSTSISPLSVFDEIDQNQVLEKRTIGQLLNILNGLVSTETPGQSEKLVVVTPKTVLTTGGFVATTFSPQEPIEVISFQTNSGLSDALNTTESVSDPTTTVVNTDISSVVNTATDSTSTEIPTTSTTLALETTTLTPKTETPFTDTPITTSTTPITATTDDPISSTLFTLPHYPTFEVSPGSVSIFSANELSNYVTPEDNVFNTVTIASKVGFDSNVLTTESVTTSTTTLEPSTESSTMITTTDLDLSTTTMPSVTTTTDNDAGMTTTTVADSVTTMTTTTESNEATTTMLITTTMSSNDTQSANPISISNRSGRILPGDLGEPIDNSLDLSTPSTTTSTTPDYFIFAVLNNNTILRKRPPTIPNKDTPFVIVGLFPNNTVVRKFPNGTIVPMDPVIKVRGFDIRPNPPPLIEITSNQVTDTTNGMTTLDSNSATVESNRMARLLATEQSTTPRVSVTSTVSTTPITSTTPPSVTNTISSTTTSMPSTVRSTTAFTSTLPPSTTSAPKVEIVAVPGATRISKSQSTTTTSASSTTTMTISSTEALSTDLSEILNGRTVDALNNLIRSETSTTTTKAPNFKTLQVNQYNEVLNIQDLINRNNDNVVYRWKPVTKTEYNSIKTSLTSTTPDPTTVPQVTSSQAPFTSSILNTESTTQNIPNLSSRNSVSSSTTTVEPSTMSTIQFTDKEAPFTSPIFSTEITIPPTTTIDDGLRSSTLTSTLPPTSTTTAAPTTQSTTPITTTTRPTTITTRRLPTSTSAPRITTTGYPTFNPSTIFPTILTTLFPNFVRGVITTPSSGISSTKRTYSDAALNNFIGDRFELLSASGTTARPTTVLPQSTSQRISTTSKATTTTTQTTTQPPTTTTTQTTTTTTTVKPTTTTTKKPKTTTGLPKVTASGTPVPTTKEETDKLFEELKKSGKLKNLNEEQRKNLEEIERIEKEQAELLKQLSLLTTMFGGQNGRSPRIPNPMGGSSNSLANRIISMAIEKDKDRASSTTDASPSSTTTKKSKRTTTKRPNSIQDQLPITQVDEVTKRTTPSLEDVLKQYNLDGLSTPSPLTSTYGKTDEALLAAILKEHGIGPTTPKVLAEKVKEAGLFEENPTTRKPKAKPKAKPRATTTTIRPPLGGRLMQGLNWLLDILDPPTTKKPAPRKSKPKSTQPAAEEELLTNQPTRITPMVTAAPVTKPNLSQDEIQDLIKQLEAVQNDPNAADQLDFSKIKSLQNLINVNEGVQVTHTGQHGATLRATPRPLKIKTTTPKDPFLTEINRKPKASTISTISVSNSIDEDTDSELSTTARTRIMPPVSLNPIPGIDDNSGDSMIRSNLLTAAVNVTRAISSFLGSAIQDAAQQVRTMFYNGSSGVIGSISGSSVPSLAGSSSRPGSNTNQAS